MIKRSFANSSEAVITDTDAQDLLSSVFPADMLVCYDKIGVVDHDNTVTLITVGFKIGSRELLLESFIPTVAGEVKTVNGRIFLPGNYRAFARFTGASDGDQVAIIVYGYLSDMIN